MICAIWHWIEFSYRINTTDQRLTTADRCIIASAVDYLDRDLSDE